MAAGILPSVPLTYGCKRQCTVPQSAARDAVENGEAAEDEQEDEYDEAAEDELEDYDDEDELVDEDEDEDDEDELDAYEDTAEYEEFEEEEEEYEEITEEELAKLPYAEQLDLKFGIGGYVSFSEGENGMPRAWICHPDGQGVEVYLHGACITQWVTPGQEDIFFCRPDSNFDSSSALSSAVPVIFPQHREGPLPENGFARLLDWEVSDTGMTDTEDPAPWITLRLTDNEETRKLWPHKFELHYRITLQHGEDAEPSLLPKGQDLSSSPFPKEPGTDELGNINYDDIPEEDADEDGDEDADEDEDEGDEDAEEDEAEAGEEGEEEEEAAGQREPKLARTGKRGEAGGRRDTAVVSQAGDAAGGVQQRSVQGTTARAALVDAREQEEGEEQEGDEDYEDAEGDEGEDEAGEDEEGEEGVMAEDEEEEEEEEGADNSYFEVDETPGNGRIIGLKLEFAVFNGDSPETAPMEFQLGVLPHFAVEDLRTQGQFVRVLGLGGSMMVKYENRRRVPVLDHNTDDFLHYDGKVDRTYINAHRADVALCPGTNTHIRMIMKHGFKDAIAYHTGSLVASAEEFDPFYVALGAGRVMVPQRLDPQAWWHAELVLEHVNKYWMRPVFDEVTLESSPPLPDIEPFLPEEAPDDVVDAELDDGEKGEEMTYSDNLGEGEEARGVDRDE